MVIYLKQIFIFLKINSLYFGVHLYVHRFFIFSVIYYLEDIEYDKYKNWKKYLSNEKNRKMMKECVISYLNLNTEFNESEKNRFVNCFLQENTIETTAYKLNKNEREIAFLYYAITTDLARASFSALIKN